MERARERGVLGSAAAYTAGIPARAEMTDTSEGGAGHAAHTAAALAGARLHRRDPGGYRRYHSGRLAYGLGRPLHLPPAAVQRAGRAGRARAAWRLARRGSHLPDNRRPPAARLDCPRRSGRPVAALVPRQRRQHHPPRRQSQAVGRARPQRLHLRLSRLRTQRRPALRTGLLRRRGGGLRLSPQHRRRAAGADRLLRPLARRARRRRVGPCAARPPA